MESVAALKLDVVAETDVGCVRTNNEDSYGYDLESRLFVVCDGMGGVAAGETASSTAVREVVERFAQDQDSGSSTEEHLQRAILSANQRVFWMAQANEELRGMGTTLVSACVEGRRVIIGNVGDSRAYFLRNGVCAQITTDHSFVNEQVRLGSMNEEEAEASPFRSVITRAIGTAETVEPDIFVGSIENGDILALVTDGLTRYADSKAIAAVILSCSSLAEACKALIETAKQQGAIDNVTCLLVQFLDAVEPSAPTHEIAFVQESVVEREPISKPVGADEQESSDKNGTKAEPEVGEQPSGEAAPDQ
ncbi:MAG TPA: Stp1/IreP family PP2C-type Ser/Thr phosphatase [Terracidiphilus sp.]|nr:Stp1/IreP family PP2C-type Ser/Thr phosphatase [Terracidiphilus sp.]